MWINLKTRVIEKKWFRFIIIRKSYARLVLREFVLIFRKIKKNRTDKNKYDDKM